jgi:peptidoglycan/LPS O-acetylase OafA/YrhL
VRFTLITDPGIDVLFVLSDYPIYVSLTFRHQACVRFMSRRVKRIYPVFAAVSAGYVTLSFVFPTKTKIQPP